MARARSPEYPAISLKEAVDRVKMIYDKDYQNRVPKAVIAEHMGYKGLSGASLPVLSALAKFGLLEGRGDETRVTDLAVTIIAHERGSPARMEALVQAAKNADLFAELDVRFPDGKASDQAIRSFLLTNKFIPSAADAAIRAYRDTKQFVEDESKGYNGEEIGQEARPMSPENQVRVDELLSRPASSFRPPEATAAMLQEVFNLDEGPVTLLFPSNLSPESYEELEDGLQFFLRRAKRRAEMRAQYDDPDRQATRAAELRRRAGRMGEEEEE
jgi:hypothetical protein